MKSKLRCLHPKNNLLRFIWYSRTYGLSTAIQSALKKLFRPNLISTPVITTVSLPQITVEGDEENIPDINRKVSVVIPTKKAGLEFDYLLKKLKNQRGIREIEIIVVDSGSEDETLEIARKEEAIVVEIPAENFDHAFSRNKGAERAGGDYILFIVQDALPLTDCWIYELVRAIENNDVAAVSCAEYPRSDCDLFYQWVLWNHYRTLNLDQDRIMGWDDSCSSYPGLRSNSQINSVALLIKRDVFSKYRFRGKYAEDLDLGVRLIKDGNKLGFLYSTRVLHSHNRPAYYSLKRSYVDTKYLKRVFPELQLPRFENPQLLFRDILDLYHKTKRVAVCLSGMGDMESKGIDIIFDQIKDLFSRPGDKSIVVERSKSTDPLGMFVGELQLYKADSTIPSHLKRNALLPKFLNSLESFQHYVSRIHKSADANLVQEIQEALLQLFALESGSSIACLYLTLAQRSTLNQFPPNLDHQLCSGI